MWHGTDFQCSKSRGGRNPQPEVLGELEVSSSWLNMAEIEINVLSRQCLDRRIPDRGTLVGEVAAWQERRYASAKPVNWRFRTEDARIKLKSLYPSIQ